MNDSPESDRRDAIAQALELCPVEWKEGDLWFFVTPYPPSSTHPETWQRTIRSRQGEFMSDQTWHKKEARRVVAGHWREKLEDAGVELEIRRTAIADVIEWRLVLYGPTSRLLVKQFSKTYIEALAAAIVAVYGEKEN